MHNLLTTGKPTSPDVTRLLESFPVHTLTPGTVVTHEELMNALRMNNKAGRYRTIISAWRRKLLEAHNVDVGCEMNVGYRVLEDRERLSHGVQDYRRANLRIAKAADRIERSDPAKMTDGEARQREHAVKLIAAQYRIGRQSVREIGRAGAVGSNPRTPLPSPDQGAA